MMPPRRKIKYLHAWGEGTNRGPDCTFLFTAKLLLPPVWPCEARSTLYVRYISRSAETERAREEQSDFRYLPAWAVDSYSEYFETNTPRGNEVCQTSSLHNNHLFWFLELGEGERRHDDPRATGAFRRVSERDSKLTLGAGEMGDRRRRAGAQGTLVGRYLLGRVVDKSVRSEVRCPPPKTCREHVKFNSTNVCNGDTFFQTAQH